ncbi:MAG TPA: DUF6714 family protein [Thermoanaerobaculia bacterium]
MNLDDELAVAWAGVVPPPQSSITAHDCDECAEVRTFFADKPWTDFVDVAALRYHYDALTLFTPRAFHYYLPAFIRATLAAPEEAALICSAIVSNVELELGVAARGMLQPFTPPQLAVVARFLRALPPLELADHDQMAVLAASLE